MKKGIFGVIVPIIIIAVLSAIQPRPVHAEQTGTSAESGVTSYIKQLYTTLQTDGFGTDTNTPNLGTYWNRIITASEWTPSGNAVTASVNSGQTFYSNSRTLLTGTYPGAGPCSTQASFNPTQTTNCGLTWTTNPSGSITGDDNLSGRGGYDPRTGLTWSQALWDNAGTLTFSATNNSKWSLDGSTVFTVSSANATTGATYTNNGATFTVDGTISGSTSLIATGTGAPTSSGTLTKSSGTGDATISFSSVGLGATNAAMGGKSASQLCSAMGNSWRLPTQIELMQAFIDGAAWNLTQINSVTSVYWGAATDGSGWAVDMGSGDVSAAPNDYTNGALRCVR